MLHITVPLPDRVSITDARNIAEDIERAVSKRTGALVEATASSIAPLTDQERRVLRSALDLARTLLPEFADDPAIVDLRDRLAGGRAETNDDSDDLDLSFPQKLAVDAMAERYGRSRVQHLSDRAVVITGMNDDIERAAVCVERDGRERWRS